MIGHPLKRILKGLTGLIPVGVFILALTLFSPMNAQAGGCVTGDICTTTADCPANCSDCVQCVGGTCELDDTYCQDRTGGDVENVCRVGLCVNADPFPIQSGCIFDDPALSGDTSLDEICYYCDPAVLAIDTCGNGVCDSPGENCSNCSLDCLTPGGAETCQDTAGIACSSSPPSICNDGEVCTQNFCDTSLGCQTTAATCSGDTSDLCCPAGCMGVPPGFGSCQAAGDPPECDVDCWPAQLCGDIYVQSNNGNPPETCDDGIPGPTAGLMPDGSTISEADCRDPGTIDECTFCGDGIIQTTSGEECDGASLGVCDQLGCDTTTCQCLPAPTPPVLIDQVQGSGPPWGPCSLNRQVDSHPVQGVLASLSLLLALGLLIGWRRQYR